MSHRTGDVPDEIRNAMGSAADDEMARQIASAEDADDCFVKVGDAILAELAAKGWGLARVADSDRNAEATRILREIGALISVQDPPTITPRLTALITIRVALWLSKAMRPIGSGGNDPD